MRKSFRTDTAQLKLDVVDHLKKHILLVYEDEVISCCLLPRGLSPRPRAGYVGAAGDVHPARLAVVFLLHADVAVGAAA
eukprot:CAMPEP_0177395046 /NCGR_PEP_ID=MMETSP0368-20130122/55910_1 /TAXON_ID=447022 ORGANISM="Scrippsiella hangoei-like, Strain SHHI-4" /NCGR_SAMPLE_ID=MMETSP0368 /ASSEMBLY_ACC=CAM_ASM_000363 /LENGTH=78 /DNA_ID=CAMNT_0018861539 /DNA_START=255 /DNA_END=488 /DNA_ORIENTATION=-